MEHASKPLILLVGPTGVGKSAAAIFLARETGGEIINGDSMQVYRGFDIGTDKPSAAERRAVPHHCLDILDPTSQFTAADFVACAFAAATGILNRGGVPYVVGGTGLYIKALLDGLFPGPGRDPAVRAALEQEAREKGLDALCDRLASVDPAYAVKVGRRDKVRIIRALEVFTVTGAPLSSHFARTESRMAGFSVLKLGLELERKELYRRIEARVEVMLEQGWLHEVERLLERYPPDIKPLQALGYRHLVAHLTGSLSLDEAIELTKIDTRHYAKRQLTWFRADPEVRWFHPRDKAALLALMREFF